MKKLLFLWVLVLTTFSLKAQSKVLIGDLYYNLYDDNTAEVTDPTSGEYSNLNNLIIPASVEHEGVSYSVTSIGEDAFYDCLSLTSITIPNSVTSIGEDAFNRCYSLTSITIPESVTSIGDYAFSACLLLTSITIPNSVTSIGYCAFNSCYALTSITIPNSVTSIGDRAFIFCNALNSIVVAEGNPNYDSRGNCNAIIETATNTLISGCKSTIIPNSVTSIGNDAFHGYWSLTSIIIPNSVTSIGDYAFNNCESLASITIPNSVTSIGYQAFSSCESLTSITVPNSVTSIGDRAFLGCSSLTSIIIPKSVTSIGDDAFYSCDALTSVTIEANTPPTIGTDLFTSNPVCTIPCGTLTVYQASDWAQYVSEFIEEECEATWQITYTSTDDEIVTPSNTDGFGANIVNNTYENGVGTITFDGPVTSIGDNVFKERASLTSITIPNSVTSIGDNAFKECASLTSITIPNSVTSIGESAFCGCSSLTTITIPNSVTSIGDAAFVRCSSLTSITIPNSVTSIVEGAFRYCDALTSIQVETGNTKYDSRGNCNAIIETATNTLIAGCQNTVIPNTITSIGKYAFAGFPSLTSITIPEILTRIGEGAFYDCTNLKSVDIPSTVKSIEQGAFHNIGIESVYIPAETIVEDWKSSMAIWYGVFSSCQNLTNITFAEGIKRIPAGVIAGCPNIRSVHIPSSVTSIGHLAFYVCDALTSITCEAMTPPALESNIFPSNLETAYIPCGTKEAYEASDWASYSITSFIEEGCVEPIEPTWQILYTSTDGNIVTPDKTDVFGANIVNNTYENGVGTITFDGPVTSIGERAFFYCDALTSITIPNSVTSIGADAFYRCSSLTSITIPEGVTSIGNSAFSACLSLTSITIPNSVTSIGYRAFNSCYALTSITIPNSVTSIGDGAFIICNALNSIVVAEGNPNYDSRGNCNAIIETATNTLISGCKSTIIPNSVTSIGNDAFHGYWSLTSIIIPNSVTSIGDDAFYSCDALTSVTIEANTPPTIGTNLFSSYPICTVPCGTLTVYQASDWAQYVSEFVEEECEELIDPTWQITYTSTDGEIVTLITLGFGANIVNNTYENGVGTITFDGPVTSIGESAFQYCQNLSYIELPNSVTSIGEAAFYGCPFLTSISIPNSVTSIGEAAFFNCLSLTSITIPNSVTSIGRGAFSWCDALTSMVVEAGNSKYDSREGCNAIIETATNTLIAGCQKTVIPNTITSIGSNAFQDCRSLTSITIPNSVTSIGYAAFADCRSLTFITIPNSVTSIGKVAFIECHDLTSATIGSSVTSIGERAFQGCGSLTSITCEAMIPPTLAYDVFPSNLETAYIPCGTKEAYEASDWASYSITSFVEEGCEDPIDPTWQITYTSTDAEIVAPFNTDDFGANIVNNTYENGVGTITFDGPVTSIGHNAFFHCQNLSYIELPNSVTSIGISAFADCTLSSITIPNSVVSIGESAFARCTSLTSIAMPNSVTSIGVGAFCYCPSITTMVVEGRNSTYDSRENCNAIIETATNTLIAGCQNTIVPNTVTSIGMSAFSDCTSLTSITIPESVTSIGKQAFYNCSQFSSVTIGSGVTSIGMEAFELCSQLTSVTIGSGVTNIGKWAFYSCSSLTSITCEATVPPTLGMYVFPSNLETVYIPCGTKEAYEASDWKQYVAEFIEECEAEQYTRDVTPNRYGTICLPFGSTDFSGATFYEIAYKAPFIIYFDEVTTLEAGKPYVFYAHSNKLVVTSDGTRVNNPLFDNGLYGTFDEIIAAATNILTNNYIVNNNSLCMCGEYCSLPANRAYVKLDEVSSTACALAPGRKRVSLSVQEENTSTALDNISEDTENIPAQKGVYDILGRKMLEPTGIGFYIIDGQKVIIAK